MNKKVGYRFAYGSYFVIGRQAHLKIVEEPNGTQASPEDHGLSSVAQGLGVRRIVLDEEVRLREGLESHCIRLINIISQSYLILIYMVNFN